MESERVDGLVEHLFRRESARLVAGLVRRLGARHLELAEDVVQEALLRALKTWSFHGPPPRPGAWLAKVARNLALDRLRQGALAESAASLVQAWEPATGQCPDDEADELRDDTLRLLFLCCHPSLSLDSRVVLTAKQVFGLGVRETGRALLMQEGAVAQRLVRAKRCLLEAGAQFELPGPGERARRLDAVLEVLYLLFNEGHSASAGSQLARADCVHEAVRLAELLLEREETREPRVFALAALFRLVGSRLEARTDPSGELVVLEAQDRSRWDQAWIQRGLRHFEASIGGERVSRYHVESAIAVAHARAASEGQTDWREVLAHYDVLMRLAPSPVVELNRAVALARVRGAAAGLAALDELLQRGGLPRYHLLDSTRGVLLWELGRREEALVCLRRALELARTEPERRLLARRIDACSRGAPSPWAESRRQD